MDNNLNISIKKNQSTESTDRRINLEEIELIKIYHVFFSYFYVKEYDNFAVPNTTLLKLH